MQGEVPGLFDKKYWQGQVIDWILQDPSFKIDAFRFVDVLPALHSASAIGSHVRDYLLREGRDMPPAARAILSMATGPVTGPVAARFIRANVSAMARRFICGSSSDRALKVLEGLAGDNLTFTADILGEATTSDMEADEYLRRYTDLVTLLGRAAAKWPHNPLLHESPAGPLPKANISVKISALAPYLDASDHEGSVSRLRERVLPLLRLARRENIFINFDLEQWATHNITYDLFEEAALHPELIDWPHIGIVLQAYLKESGRDFDRLLELGRRRGVPFTVRLVKGAYWDYEVVHARQKGFACPVFDGKGLTDDSYEFLSRRLMENHELLAPAFASHNLRSLVHAAVAAEELGLEKNAIEIQMLYGMAEPERKVFADDGFRVRVYCPIGELLPGMAYLVRRLLENTSNSGFLRQSFHEGVSMDAMLSPPSPGPRREERPEKGAGGIDEPFVNTGLLDFCEESVRTAFDRAIAGLGRSLPLEVPLVIDGRETVTEDVHVHPVPEDPQQKASTVSRGDVSHVEAALEAAARAFPLWRDTPLRDRAEMLEKLADLLEGDRFGLAALEGVETAKPRLEADADVAEAIDFCRYYARRALLELGPEKQGDVPGEENFLFYEGRGPTAVIAPWNFPLAILCGMTTAALVAGNSVVIKPSSASSAIAHRFFRHLVSAGFPPGVVQFLPCAGEEAGSFLVEHPAVAQVAFTGSREVGLGIIRRAADTRPGQVEVKRVICEMGGKNGIIVDEDADPDAALKGVVHSAFGYAGQKCSACSRLILVGEIHAPFIKRLKEACRSLPLAPATDPSCRLGPVIDERARDRLLAIIADPPGGAELLFRGEVPQTGYFVPPVLFGVRDVRNPLMQEELFGPVLTIIQASTFSEALDMANSTDFALTGSVYSRSPTNLALARSRFRVGNLYLNRGCTGALVGRQPFGGFGRSGIGTKAGGPGYLRNFANPRCVSENTMRSGFTPELQL
jgi:RHH-type proline utilization regulon transcriptional repressor/proline dehydrogenase/delta 1-pyrroline-5-carboxylate dehydrogenase